jgi:hypothetical protein
MAARTCKAQGIVNRILITKIKCFYAFAMQINVFREAAFIANALMSAQIIQAVG